jgi:hypothetical protein
MSLFATTFFFISRLLQMWQKIIPTKSTYGENLKMFPKFIWQMSFLKKGP